MAERPQLSRRRWLGAVATATAASACGSGPQSLTERLVGQAPERGHMVQRTRRARSRGSEIAERTQTQVVIVGAGAAGMSAARHLVREGITDLRVIELEAVLGGTARAGEHGRSAYPMGAHYLPSPHPECRPLLALLEDAGVILGYDDAGAPDYDPRFVCAAPVERHRLGGLWYPGLFPAAGQTSEDARQWSVWLEHLRALDGRTGPDGRRLFELPLEHSSVELRMLDELSAAEHLDQLGITSWRVRWTVDYACRDDYGCRLEQTSAFAALHHYLCRGLEDTHDRVVLAWPQGNQFLVDAMATSAGIAGRKLSTDTAVVRIDAETGEVDALDLATDQMIGLQARAVLWAAPRFILPHVLDGARDPLPAHALTYSPWLVANVEVTRKPAGVGAELAWDNVVVGADHLGYVVANHGEPLTRRQRPGAVLTYYEPLSSTDAAHLAERRSWLASASLSDLSAHVIAALESMHPTIRSSITAVDIARWGHAMVRPSPGLLFGGTLERAREPIGRVLACGTDVGGVALFEQAFFNGIAAAKWALAQLRRGSDHGFG